MQFNQKYVYVMSSHAESENAILCRCYWYTIEVKPSIFSYHFEYKCGQSDNISPNSIEMNQILYGF